MVCLITVVTEQVPLPRLGLVLHIVLLVLDWVIRVARLHAFWSGIVEMPDVNQIESKLAVPRRTVLLCANVLVGARRHAVRLGAVVPEMHLIDVIQLIVLFRVL